VQGAGEVEEQVQGSLLFSPVEDHQQSSAKTNKRMLQKKLFHCHTPALVRCMGPTHYIQATSCLKSKIAGLIIGGASSSLTYATDVHYCSCVQYNNGLLFVSV
jgi:hypothetical protein